jgi:hypothetical protein
MDARPTSADAFALRPGFHQGDSVLLLGQGRYGATFDARPARYRLIAVIPSLDDTAALEALEGARRLVDSGKAAVFAALPGSKAVDDLERRFPYVGFLEAGENWTTAFGAEPAGCWVILDPMLRIQNICPLRDRDLAFDFLDRLAAQGQASDLVPAPILVLSDVFEPDLCRHLIDVFDRDGGKQTGFMQDGTVTTVERFDQSWKRRRDIVLSDPSLVAGMRAYRQAGLPRD